MNKVPIDFDETFGEYKPIPVSEAVKLADRYEKSHVVILAHDPVHQRMHATSYGREPRDKEEAADVGERCIKLICGDGFQRRTSYEDYRYVAEGERAEQLQNLLRAAKRAEHAMRTARLMPSITADQSLDESADDLRAAREAAEVS